MLGVGYKTTNGNRDEERERGNRMETERLPIAEDLAALERNRRAREGMEPLGPAVKASNDVVKIGVTIFLTAAIMIIAFASYGIGRQAGAAGVEKTPVEKAAAEAVKPAVKGDVIALRGEVTTALGQVAEMLNAHAKRLEEYQKRISDLEDWQRRHDAAGKGGWFGKK